MQLIYRGSDTCMVYVTGTGGLQLFVGKDGTAVLGSTARASTHPTQPVSYAPSMSDTLSIPNS